MEKKKKKSTILFKKYKSGEFLDFDNPDELKHVMDVLNKLMVE